MSAGPVNTLWHAHFPHRPSVRRVEPTHPATPPHRQCERDRLERIPFDKFLERQNAEFRAAVERHHDRCRAQRQCPAPLATREPEPWSSRPASPQWPRIGDVTPVPPAEHPARLRTVEQYLPPIQPGRVTDLLV